MRSKERQAEKGRLRPKGREMLRSFIAREIYIHRVREIETKGRKGNFRDKKGERRDRELKTEGKIETCREEGD